LTRVKGSEVVWTGSVAQGGGGERKGSAGCPREQKEKNQGTRCVTGKVARHLWQVTWGTRKESLRGESKESLRVPASLARARGVATRGQEEKDESDNTRKRKKREQTRNRTGGLKSFQVFVGWVWGGWGGGGGGTLNIKMKERGHVWW